MNSINNFKPYTNISLQTYRVQYEGKLTKLFWFVLFKSTKLSEQLRPELIEEVNRYNDSLKSWELHYYK